MQGDGHLTIYPQRGRSTEEEYAAKQKDDDKKKITKN
jgi:hypothetical protein